MIASIVEHPILIIAEGGVKLELLVGAGLQGK
jgi:hypothetical protein